MWQPIPFSLTLLTSLFVLRYTNIHAETLCQYTCTANFAFSGLFRRFTMNIEPQEWIDYFSLDINRPSTAIKQSMM